MIESMIHTLTFEQKVELNKMLAKQFTKFMKGNEVEFSVISFRGVAVVKSILPPKTTSFCDEFRVKVKVIKYSERRWPEFVEAERPSRYTVRRANREIRYEMNKEVRKYSEFFSIKSWRMKIVTVEYDVVKN
jgi:hypothetical protein